MDDRVYPRWRNTAPDNADGKRNETAASRSPQHRKTVNSENPHIAFIKGTVQSVATNLLFVALLLAAQKIIEMVIIWFGFKEDDFVIVLINAFGYVCVATALSCQVMLSLMEAKKFWKNLKEA